MKSLDNFYKAAFTVDNVIFGFDEGDLKVLLIKRGEEPYINQLGLPGYFVKENEGLDEAASRVLAELTGLNNVYLEQVNTFGLCDRHPVGRVITVAYYSLLKIGDYQLNVNKDSIAQNAGWYAIKDLGELAFDHNKIFNACFNRLKLRVQHRPVGFELLPPKFTLTELQHLYESILETTLDKRNFRKKIFSMNLIIDLKESQEGVAHRPAKLYKFDKLKYQQLLSEGFVFDI